MSLKISAEVSLDSDPSVLAWDDNLLYCGTEDGNIRVFNSDLVEQRRWRAHECGVYALSAGPGCSRVHSASVDGARAWQQDGTDARILPVLADVGALRLHGGYLFAGDESGVVSVFVNGKVKTQYETMEEVKDIAVKLPYMFTARALYVTVTEIHPDIHPQRFTVVHSFEGRAPLLLTPDGGLLLCTSRDGRSLIAHSSQPDFLKLGEVKASDMIINTLATSPSSDEAWSGGWDNRVCCWMMTKNGKLTVAGDLNVGGCVNYMVAPQPHVTYAAVAGGKIVRVEA